MSLALQTAVRHHQAGDLTAAEAGYRSFLLVQPDNVDALHLLGVLLGQKGQAGEGLPLIRKAQAAAPGNPEIAFNLGRLLQAEEELEGAAEAYEAVLKIVPGEASTLSNLGAVRQAQGDHKSALRLYEQVLAAHPNDPQATYNRGSALKEMGDTAAAYQAFLKAESLAPNFIVAIYNAAEIELAEGKSEQALDTLQRALVHAPDDAVCHGYRTIALQQLGRSEELARLSGYDSFVDAAVIDTPGAFDDLKAFNAALETHIVTHPSLTYAPPLQATRNGQHTGSLLVHPKGPFEAFEAVIRNRVDAYIKDLPNDRPDHPMCLAPPKDYALDVWAVVMETQGHQLAHIHGDGYLSGVYYCKLPDVVEETGADHEGWIEFGHPPDTFPLDRSPDLELFKPEEGLMILFPSYLYHRTVPFSGDQGRISIAFDIIRKAA